MKTKNVVLWVVQALLAALFLFGGVMKFVMPLEEMTKQSHLPGWFLHFIGVCEVLGGLGLILPGLTRIAPVLAPLAASGLVIIMIGAVVVSAPLGVGQAAFPFVVGVLAASVAWGRWRIVPHRGREASASAAVVGAAQ